MSALLTWRLSDVDYDLESVAWMMADALRDLDAHPRHLIADLNQGESRNRLRRLYQEAFALAAFALRGVPDVGAGPEGTNRLEGDATQFRMEWPSCPGLPRWIGETVIEKVHSFMVAFALEGWLRPLLPTQADVWLRQLERQKEGFPALAQAISSSVSGNSTSRRPLHPF